jgi:hypothetical protein
MFASLADLLQLAALEALCTPPIATNVSEAKLGTRLSGAMRAQIIDL